MQQQKILVADKKRVLPLGDIHSQALQDTLFRVDRAYQAGCRFEKVSPHYTSIN